MNRKNLRWLIWIGCPILIGIGVYWHLGTDPYRYKTIEATVELIVEDEPVRLVETFVCKRVFGTDVGMHYRQITSSIFAHALKSGNGVVVSLFGGSCNDFPRNYYPPIYWFKNFEDPRYGELYFSEPQVEISSQRIQFISFKHIVKSQSAFPDILSAFRDSSIQTKAPWVERDKPVGFWGYIVQVQKLDGFDSKTREFVESLSPGKETIVFQYSDLPEESVSQNIFVPLSPRLMGRDPGYFCRSGTRRERLCSAFRQTYGIERIGNIGILEGSASVNGFLILEPFDGRRRPKDQNLVELRVLGQDFRIEHDDVRNTFLVVKKLGAVIRFQKYELRTKDLTEIWD